ncbi:MAG: class I SAM-dependent methyltransferase [Planctomycetales bacterium]|nr:class I SAM-dependent methyltransferase [Planctomycetales bacterium]
MTNQRESIPVVVIPCPLCGSEEHRVLHPLRDYLYGFAGDFGVVRCRGCRHMYMNPRPADDSLLACYPTEYAPHRSVAADSIAPAASIAPDSGSPPSRPLWRGVARRIPGLRPFLYRLGQEQATYLPSLPAGGSGRLLEIGCGNGRFLEQAAAQGWNVDGIEPGAEAAAACQARGLRVQCCTLAEADLAAASRQAIVLWMVLEHVPDPRQLLDKVWDTLSPDGVLALSVPNGGGFERRLFGKYWLGYEAPRHLQVFTAHSIERLLREIGFEQIRIVHQANVRYWWGSLAAWGLEHVAHQRWPRRWLGYFLDEPPRSLHWLSLIPAKLLAVGRCGGRITVRARKPA